MIKNLLVKIILHENRPKNIKKIVDKLKKFNLDTKNFFCPEKSKNKLTENHFVKKNLKDLKNNFLVY